MGTRPGQHLLVILDGVLGRARAAVDEQHGGEPIERAPVKHSKQLAAADENSRLRMVDDELALVRGQTRADADTGDACPHAGGIDFNEMKIVREKDRCRTISAGAQREQRVGDACAASLDIPIRHRPGLVDHRDPI